MSLKRKYQPNKRQKATNTQKSPTCKCHQNKNVIKTQMSPKRKYHPYYDRNCPDIA